MSCRFPKAGDLSAFWRLLCEGVDAITEVPRSRFDIDAHFDPAGGPGKLLSREGGFLDHVETFDSAFFRIAPREAERMDPQQRLLLEVAWEALEHGGQVPSRLVGSDTGVFVGLLGNDYGDALVEDIENVNIYVNTGAARSVVSGRLSYFFGFEGPSLSVDTACSSSMVALHLACESIRSGDCTQALAAGCNVVLAPNLGVGWARAGNQAKDGRCKAFDARGDGFVRSEGIAVVVLKRLSAALADNDPIQAVIRGTAVTNDGSTNGLLMTPSQEGQMKALRKACRMAGLHPSSVQFVEAHGTGTRAGDPVEMSAIGTVYGEDRDPSRPLFVGSVKSNIGHTEGAAGLAGTIKAALALQHRLIPANLHFKTPNPEIAWTELPVRVPTHPMAWPPAEKRLAGVSSFGISGTNAHVILEEAPEPPRTPSAEGPFLLAFSAQTREGLAQLGREYQTALLRQEVPLQDLCYTSTQRRTHHEHRVALVGHGRKDLSQLLQAFATGETATGLSQGHAETPPRIAFVFPGQGSQWFGMGRELCEREPVFRDQLRACDEAIRAHAGWSLSSTLQAREEDARWEDVDFIQPAVFAMQVSLAALWRSWGIVPEVVVGHSLGEVAAAHVAGILSLEDAVRVICERSLRVKQTRGQGRMLAVELTRDEAIELALEHEGKVSLGVNNGPRSAVLSGDPQALEQIARKLEQRGVFSRFVKVDYASHSPQMDALRAPLLEALDAVQPREGHIPFYSTARDARVEGQALGAGYWFENLRNPVLFASAVQSLAQQGVTGFVELSPHPLLTGAVRDCLAECGVEGFVTGSLRREEPERANLLRAAAVVHAHGGTIDFARAFPEGGRCVSLPNYPWKRERHWLDVHARRALPAPRPRGTHPLLGERMELSFDPSRHLWQGHLRSAESPSLWDHRVHDCPILPGVAYAELALAAGEVVLGQAPLEVRELSVRRALFLPAADAHRELQVLATKKGPGQLSVQVFSRAGTDAGWEEHAGAEVVARAEEQAAPDELAEVLALRTGGTTVRSGEELYAAIARHGYAYGPAFRGIQRVWSGPAWALAELALPDAVVAEAGAYHLHPALLDACLQTVLAPEGGPTSVLPVRFERVRVERRGAVPKWAHAQVTPAGDGGSFIGHVRVFDETGALVARLEGVKLQPADAAGGTGTGSDSTTREPIFELSWVPARPEAMVPVANGARAGALVILMDGTGVGEALATRAERAQRTVVRVHAADAFALPSPTEFRVRPGEAEDFHLVFDALRGRAAGIDAVLHLWALDFNGPDVLDAAQIAQQAAPGPLSVLRVLHELSEWTDRPPRVWVATRGAQAVGPGQAQVNLAQATLWGFGRVVPQELPALWGGLVDLDPLGDPDGHAQALWDVLSAPAGENQIAVRGGRRHHARLTRLSSGTEKTGGLVLRPDGSYLITGGLGDLGLETAYWLVDHGARRLVLMGKTPLPPREGWEEALAAGGRTAHQIAQVRKLEAKGAAVHLATCDVGSEKELSAFLDGFRREGWPALRGVIHSAGVVADKTLAQLGGDPAGAAEALARCSHPKVIGAWNLHRLLEAEPLDFFILYSSVAATLGNPGQAMYASCNSFLDALAHHRRTRGLAAQSINWGPWSELGLAVRLDTGDRLARRGLHSLSPQEGMAAFGRIVELDRAQLNAMPLDWSEWRSHFPTPLLDELEDLDRAPTPPAPVLRPTPVPVPVPAPVSNTAPAASGVLAVPESERASVLLQQLGVHLQRVLGRPEPVTELTRPLNKMGMDSLMAVELKNRIERTVGVSVPVVKLLSGMSLSDLSRFVLENLPRAAPEATPVVAPVAVPAPAAPVSPAPVSPAPARGKARTDLLARPEAARSAALTQQMGIWLQRILGRSEPVTELGRPLNKMGMDSLMAVEFKNRLDRELGVVIPVVKLLSGVCLKDVTQLVLAELGTEPAKSPGPTAPPAPAKPTDPKPAILPTAAERVQSMSDTDVDQMLKQMLAKLGGQA